MDDETVKEIFAKAKPCPFCGEKHVKLAKIVNTTFLLEDITDKPYSPYKTERYVIECLDCCYTFRGLGRTVRELVTEWNDRVVSE